MISIFLELYGWTDFSIHGEFSIVYIYSLERFGRHDSCVLLCEPSVVHFLMKVRIKMVMEIDYLQKWGVQR
jgi:hypothetical protein